MGSSNEDAIKTLNELIQLDYDAVKAYDVALEKIAEDDMEVREDLEVFKADHERHIADLTRVILSLGGEPEEAGRDLRGIFLEGMTMLRSVTGTVGALKAMRMNERMTNKVYDKAAEVAVPPLASGAILRNLEDERRHLTVIELHLDRFTEEDMLDEPDDFEYEAEDDREIADGTPIERPPGARI